MATSFGTIKAAVLADTSLTGTNKLSTQDLDRFIRAAYHEVFHTRPDLRTQFNETTGEITRLPEVMADTADSLPDFFDGWFSAIQHYVKWRILTFFRMDSAQATRAKIEEDAFRGEMGTYELVKR